MLVGTIVLIFNLISLVWKEKLLISWGWVLGIYGIEMGIYVLVLLIIVLIAWWSSK